MKEGDGREHLPYRAEFGAGLPMGVTMHGTLEMHEASSGLVGARTSSGEDKCRRSASAYARNPASPMAFTPRLR